MLWQEHIHPCTIITPGILQSFAAQLLSNRLSLLYAVEVQNGNSEAILQVCNLLVFNLHVCLVLRIEDLYHNNHKSRTTKQQVTNLSGRNDGHFDGRSPDTAAEGQTCLSRRLAARLSLCLSPPLLLPAHTVNKVLHCIHEKCSICRVGVQI